MTLQHDKHEYYGGTCCLHLWSRKDSCVGLLLSSATHLPPSCALFSLLLSFSYAQQPISGIPFFWFHPVLISVIPPMYPYFLHHTADPLCGRLSKTAWCHHIPGPKLNIECCEILISHSWNTQKRKSNFKYPPTKNMSHNLGAVNPVSKYKVRITQLFVEWHHILIFVLQHLLENLFT